MFILVFGAFVWSIALLVHLLSDPQDHWSYGEWVD